MGELLKRTFQYSTGFIFQEIIQYVTGYLTIFFSNLEAYFWATWNVYTSWAVRTHGQSSWDTTTCSTDECQQRL